MVFPTARRWAGLPTPHGTWWYALLGNVHGLALQNICSRDIKLENTLVKGSVQSPVLKICDFGFSKDTDEQSQAQTRVGTFGVCVFLKASCFGCHT